MKTNRLWRALMAMMLLNGNFVWSQTELFKDDFNAAPLDVTNKWRRGDNSSSAVRIDSAFLKLDLIDGQAAWIVTQDAFPLSNTTITAKIIKATKDGSIGICPSYPKPGNIYGIYLEANWYRFYVGRDSVSNPDAPPYKLYAYKKKRGGSDQSLATVVLPSPYGKQTNPFYMRLRFDTAKIYFEYSTTGAINDWNLVHQEDFDLKVGGIIDYSLNNAFHAEIAATDNSQNAGVFKVDDFSIVTSNPAPTRARIILDDPLNSSTFVNRKTNPNSAALKVGRSYAGNNSNFSAPGWKPSGDLDLVVYDLGRYIERGSLEIDVKQFEPALQNSMERHHVIAMFRMPWGGHHPVENIETIWDLHTGTDSRLAGGIKFYAHTYDYKDEDQHFVPDSIGNWDKTLTHRVTVYWEPNQIKYLHDGVAHVTHLDSNAMQLRYIYVGRDLTVSGDRVTGFNKNQYKTMRNNDGPIYFNVVAKELRSIEQTPPSISNVTTVNVYNNGARISWSTTSEATVCYVEYGTTTAYGKKDTLLGPPANTFTTLLSKLTANTSYHYRINAEDDAGNVTQSGDFTFSTTTHGAYVFKPVADTYIEDDDRNPRTKSSPDYPWLYGPTRAEGNYGWMNLMTSDRRDSFLQFNITGVTGTISKVTLRLHGRQSSDSTGGVLKQFTPIQGNWENHVTWKDATSAAPLYIDRDNYTSQSWGSINSITADQWYEFDVTTATKDVSNNYYFVLKGTGQPPNGALIAKLNCGAFDSRESTNFQPELIVEAPVFAEVTTINNLPGIEDGDVAWGDYNRDGNMDIVITGLGAADSLSKLFRNNNSGDTLFTFAEVDTLLPLKFSAADWGDFDMDNDLDLLLTGQADAGQLTKVYRGLNDNDLAVYPTPTLIGVKYGDLAWGNYNQDRYLDILISGWGTASGYATRVYQGGLSGSTRTWTHNSSIVLPQLRYSSVAWGDNDLDGWLDLLVAGTHSTNTDSIKIFRNQKNLTNGTRKFLAVNIQPTQAMTAAVAWGNFDADGDLDIAYAGRTNTLTSVYKRKSDATFELIDDAALTDVKASAVAWGDYDNDGDLDLLVTGEKSNPTARISKVYRTDKYSQDNIKLVDIGASLAGVHKGAAAWGDYDNDGDLDILLAGNTNASGQAGRITKIYKNILNVPNTKPTVPGNLTVSYSANDSIYTLRWDKSTDAQTPQAALTYNVMIGTTSNGTEIISPLASKQNTSSNGKRWLPAPGNAGTRDYYLLNRRGLANGTYYWKVQAIDNIWKGSAFSVEDTFTVPHTAKAAWLVDRDSTADAQAIPKKFALSHNYPNPFNPSTRLNLDLPEGGRVKAIIYNLMGQEVARLQDGAMTAGYRYLNWDGRNKFGANASSGVYLVKVIFEGVSGLRKESTSRILLVK